MRNRRPERCVTDEDYVRRARDVGGETAPVEIYPRYTRPAVWSHPLTGVGLLFVLVLSGVRYVRLWKWNGRAWVEA